MSNIQGFTFSFDTLYNTDYLCFMCVDGLND